VTGEHADRLTGTLGRRTQRLVFGSDIADQVAELELITRVDLAHIVMLTRQGLLGARAATALVDEIRRLRSGGFVALRARPAPRGLYLMYESWLIERLGDEVGGMLHAGRSRNDLKATTTLLRLRSWLLDFVTEAARLQTILLCRARAHRDVVMPVYTHFQAAMPITYGHYLLGVAVALGRDIEAVRDAAGGLRRCPLGACAVAGTDLPIAPEVTAALLGFDAGPVHAVDAVASRDVLLRALSAVTGVGLTISRLATDLQLWSTEEFGFVTFPERLVGGSSAMPQKRNAFLLEHLKAAAGVAVGAWTAAAGMIKSTPFTNTIEVGTEATGAIWPGLDAVSRAVLLAQVIASGARPVPARMAERARLGFTTATSVANQLVLAGVPFRTAHHVVGAAVRTAVDDGSATLGVIDLPRGRGALKSADLAEVVAATRVGGGPGSFDEVLAHARADAAGHAEWCRVRCSALARADRELSAAVSALTETDEPTWVA
jgi:argininosuccinate lyase